MFACAPLIKEIGRGKEGARSLSRDQARELWSAILSGQVSDLELGAVLIALRVKGESRDELAGFCDATQALLPDVLGPSAARPTVVFPSYNGARRRPNLLPLLAGALARLGYPVLVHGHPEDPTGRITTAQVFSALRWPKIECNSFVENGSSASSGQAVNFASSANPNADTAAALSHGAAPPVDLQNVSTIQNFSMTKCLADAHNQRWPLFVETGVLHPGLVGVLERRRVLGVRNAAHTVVKLIQPVRSPSVLVTSYTHPEFWHLQRDVLAQLGTNALVIRGHEGEAVAHPQKAPRMDSVFNGVSSCADEGDETFTDMPERNPDRDAQHTAEQTLEMLVRMDREGLSALPPGLVRQVQAIEKLAQRVSP